MDTTRDDQGTTDAGTAGRSGGRRGRRAARRAAELAVATAGPVAAARRGRRVLRTSVRLARAGIVVGGIGGAVWWALQRPTRRPEAGRVGVAGPEMAGGGTVGGGVTVDDQRAATGSDAAGAPGPAAAGDRVVDLREAADLLQVEPARIPVMVESGLLQPVGGDADQLRFRAAEVEAVRLQGG